MAAAKRSARASGVGAVTELTADHLRAIFHRFEAIDQSLREIQATLNDVDGADPFRDRVDGVTDAHRRAVARFSKAMRGRMEAILAARGASPQPKAVSARRAMQPFLTAIWVLIEELRPAQLKGYGELSPAAAGELEAIASELHTLLAAFRERLNDADGREGPHGD